jgi:aspartyl/glutamyl-tRNA(Asn/Gln) amidotransferase C subunit
MSQITIEEIKKLFALARLPLDEKLIASRQKDMEEILGYVASLSKLDTSSAKEVHGGADFLNAFRVDEMRPASKDERDSVVRSFPTSEADLNKVLGIMEK